MLNYSQAFYQLKEKLQPLYDADEGAAITHIYLEYLTGLSKSDRLLKKDNPLTEKQQEKYDTATKALIKGKPVQYITNSSWFMGREFIVNESVLIPRPETEELVQWILEDTKSKNKDSDPNPKTRILDIGAGSGCIGISLARLIPNPVVSCADISKEAIEVLKTNIEWVLTPEEKKAGADNITVKTVDILNETQRNKQLGRYDVIVSNPPYIPISEKPNMHKNVKDYEPEQALFVPANDALLFYRAIAEFGKTHLNREGTIYCELDANHAQECKALFEEHGYSEVAIKKDIHENWRMLKAILPAMENK